ncbi:MAG: glycosyltransferase family 4 protein [bacterium]
MKIAMIIPFLHYQTGGMERQAWQLARQLTDQGVEVHFITGLRFWERWTRSLHQRDQIDGIIIHRLPGLYPPNASKLWPSELIRGAKNIFKHERFDLIHAHQLFSAGLAAAVLKKLHRSPIIGKAAGGGRDGDISDLHHWPLTEKKLSYLRSIDRFIAITPQIADELKSIGVPDHQIIQIPNGVDTDLFAPPEVSREEAKQKVGFNNQPIVIFIGRLIPTKQVDRLLRAWPRVIAQVPKAKLLLIGKPDSSSTYSSQLRSLIQSDWKDSVIFKGTVELTRDWLQAADVFVLPSRAEGMSNALLEAGSVGLPIVASSIPANQYVLKNNKSALVFAPNRTDELAKHIITLLTQPKFAQQLGQQAKKDILERFSLKAVTNRYLNLYQELLGLK